MKFPLLCWFTGGYLLFYGGISIFFDRRPCDICNLRVIILSIQTAMVGLSKKNSGLFDDVFLL